ncbi:MAG: response regulator [bacterium]|nr:response regulator [bacterium]
MTTHSILIVDDDEFLLDMYSLKFRQSEFEVDVALGGVEALEKIKKGFEPDAVLFDLVMPDMDGFEFLINVKRNNLLENSKMVVLTNLGQKEDIEKGTKLGADDYIIKAYFTPTEVVNKIKSLIAGV